MAVGGFFPVLVINPAPGGGASAQVTFEVDNPIPVVSGIAPNSASAGSSSLPITVNGSGFVQTSVVEWNGQPLATTYQSGIALSAVVPLFDLATGGIGNITVVTPSPAGGTSAQIQFVVTNPIPTLVSASPSGATTGGPDLTILLTGTNFVPGSIASWNGTTILPSTFETSTTLQITVPASLIATAGTGVITVTNPIPVGGTTSGLSILVSNGVPTVTALTPSSVGIKSPTLTLTVTGSNYATGATVEWTPVTSPPSAPMALATTYVSGSQLTAIVPSTLLTTAGNVTVSVTNLSPGGTGGGTSVANQTFTIANPVPVLSSLSPTTGLAGANNIVLTLGGTNFVPTSVAMLGSLQLITTFISANLLTAVVPQSSVPTAGQQTVTVVNPARRWDIRGADVHGRTGTHVSCRSAMLSAPYDYSNTDFAGATGTCSKHSGYLRAASEPVRD